MAAIVQNIVTSDLSGAEGAVNVTFAHNGKAYEIDLTNLEAGNLARSLAKYIEAGREVKATAKRQGRPARSGQPSQAGIIRAWAIDNGVQVGQRGRLHPDVVAAYEAAQVSAPAETVETEAPAEA